MRKLCRLHNRRLRIKLYPMNVRSPKQMRERLYDSVRQDFCKAPFTERMSMLQQLFLLPADPPGEGRLKTHRAVRNIVQHNHGIFRQKYIRDVGLQRLELQDDDGNPKVYTDGEPIELSLSEIDDLVAAIRDYSQNFEELT